ncbi:hypothetical protein [Lishizhenia sp.]|uniref:hypothetical protein n=1 Tax=Lishizhenia sp. TaxID=2497594 RepID=UPI00299E66FB|nr:hypothetical protein [Lishizhenia sp.]MDX1445320.1 hypothetical protein [Lishizhenia sp.]
MNEIELKHQFSNIQYFEQLRAQVEKDFALVGLQVDFSKCSDLEKLEKHLLEDLRYFSINQAQALVQLFYSIDLNENRLEQMLQDGQDNYYRQLAQAILQREAQKVILRIHYSSH